VIKGLAEDFDSRIESVVYLGVVIFCVLVIIHYQTGLWRAWREKRWGPSHWVGASIVLAFSTGGLHVLLWGAVRWAAVFNEPAIAVYMRDLALVLASPIRFTLAVSALGHLYAAHALNGTTRRLWYQTAAIMVGCAGLYAWLTIG